jgi:ferredoxin--NADP+ reductase
MYKILRKEVFSETVKLMVLEAPLVAHKAKAGQFVIVRMDETGERIPLTIADFDSAAGTVTIIFQEVGKSTMQMGLMEEGDYFENVVGPLGHATEIKNYGKVIVVAGGVGVAPVFPIARALKQISPERADAIALYFFSGLTYAEAGRVLKKNEAAVKMLVSRGLQDLRERTSLVFEVER